MGALVNVFKSLFGGILGFFGGLFGGKKGADGFYAVADDAALEELPPASAAPAKAAPAAKADAKAGKTKAAPAKVAAPVKAAKVASAPTPEELIVAAVSAKAPDQVAQAASGGTAGFATQYMVPTLTSGRRTPGPSLKGFKAMAKEIRG